MSSHIRDINLWESGAQKIVWVRNHMPLLDSIEQEFLKTKPFAGLKIALSVHMEAKTARLCLCLAAGGAEMYATGCNPLSTQDDVAAALVHFGLNVFAIHGATMEEYEADLRRVLEVGPNIIIDDGGDLVTLMHKEFPHLIPNVIGGCEETTTGILRLKAMDRAGTLKFPMMLVNDADCKHLSRACGTASTAPRTSSWRGRMSWSRATACAARASRCGPRGSAPASSSRKWIRSRPSKPRWTASA